MEKRRILILASDSALYASLAERLRLDGMQVVDPPASAANPDVNLVIAVCDSWPAPWTLELLRSHFRAVSCMLLSGSPVSGPYVAARFKRGYFLALPTSGRRIADLARTLLA